MMTLTDSIIMYTQALLRCGFHTFIHREGARTRHSLEVNPKPCSCKALALQSYQLPFNGIPFCFVFMRKPTNFPFTIGWAKSCLPSTNVRPLKSTCHQLHVLHGRPHTVTHTLSTPSHPHTHPPLPHTITHTLHSLTHTLTLTHPSLSRQQQHTHTSPPPLLYSPSQCVLQQANNN